MNQLGNWLMCVVLIDCSWYRPLKINLVQFKAVYSRLHAGKCLHLCFIALGDVNTPRIYQQNGLEVLGIHPVLCFLSLISYGGHLESGHLQSHKIVDDYTVIPFWMYHNLPTNSQNSLLMQQPKPHADVLCMQPPLNARAWSDSAS